MKFLQENIIMADKKTTSPLAKALIIDWYQASLNKKTMDTKSLYLILHSTNK
jgi:hypothetical protein